MAPGGMAAGGARRQGQLHRSRPREAQRECKRERAYARERSKGEAPRWCLQGKGESGTVGKAALARPTEASAIAAVGVNGVPAAVNGVF